MSVAIIGEGILGVRVGEPMTQNNRQLKTPLFLVFLMVLAPFAAAANVTTFGNGNSTTDVELRDGTAFVDVDSGTINLPASETVTSASMDISTSMVEHSAHTRVDIETMPRLFIDLIDPRRLQGTRCQFDRCATSGDAPALRQTASESGKTVESGKKSISVDLTDRPS